MGRCSRDALSATPRLHGTTVVRLSVSNASDVTSFASTNSRVLYYLLFLLSPSRNSRRPPRALLSTPEDLRRVANIINRCESHRNRRQHAVHALLSLFPCPRGWNRYAAHTTALRLRTNAAQLPTSPGTTGYTSYPSPSPSTRVYQALSVRISKPASPPQRSTLVQMWKRVIRAKAWMTQERRRSCAS